MRAIYIPYEYIGLRVKLAYSGPHDTDIKPRSIFPNFALLWLICEPLTKAMNFERESVGKEIALFMSETGHQDMIFPRLSSDVLRWE